MTSHNAELSRNMDRITQLQDGIDNLVTIMYSTLSFLTRKADFKQVNPDIPITQTIPRPDETEPPRETLSENFAELAQDFLKKAKQIEYLISILPPHNTNPVNNNNPDSKDQAASIPSASQLPPESKDKLPPLETSSQQSNNATVDPQPTPNDDDSTEFDELQADIHAAQNEYDQALLDAESLRSELKEAIDKILDHRIKLLSTDPPDDPS